MGAELFPVKLESSFKPCSSPALDGSGDECLSINGSPASNCTGEDNRSGGGSTSPRYCCSADFHARLNGVKTVYGFPSCLRIPPGTMAAVEPFNVSGSARVINSSLRVA